MTSDSSLRAIMLMICAMAFVPAGDAAGKVLASNFDIAPAFIAWSRFVIGALFILPFLAPAGLKPHLFLDWRIWLRACLIIGGITSILTALQTEPIADVYAAFFVGPILSYFLSCLLLKEPFEMKRAGLLLIGFIGVLLVVKPGINMRPGMLIALMAGMFYGSFLVASRWLASAAGGKMMLFSQLSIGALILAPTGLPHIPTFTWEITVWTMASALGSAIGNLFLILAYQRMQATKLSPLVYVQLVAATFFGLVIFGVVPDWISLMGLALLLASGAVSVLLNRQPAR